MSARRDGGSRAPPRLTAAHGDPRRQNPRHPRNDKTADARQGNEEAEGERVNPNFEASRNDTGPKRRERAHRRAGEQDPPPPAEPGDEHKSEKHKSKLQSFR